VARRRIHPEVQGNTQGKEEASMPIVGQSRNTPVLDFGSLTVTELRELMRVMRSARERATDNGMWAEAHLSYLLARSAFLVKWIPAQR
jgi:hypothetical protein